MIEWSDDPRTAPASYDLCGKWHGFYVDIVHCDVNGYWRLSFGCGTVLHKIMGTFFSRDRAVEYAEDQLGKEDDGLRWLVVRACNHSPSSSTTMWRVLSRPMKRRDTADEEQRWHQSENPYYKVFLVQAPE